MLGWVDVGGVGCHALSPRLACYPAPLHILSPWPAALPTCMHLQGLQQEVSGLQSRLAELGAERDGVWREAQVSRGGEAGGDAGEQGGQGGEAQGRGWAA